MPIQIECPSGLTIVARGFVGRDARFLSDRKLARSGRVVDTMLGACFKSLEEPGPYSFDPDKPVPWGKVIVGDRDHVLVRVRATTYGPDYDFDVQCRNGNCRETFGWSINLDELPVRKLSPESIERFRNGNRFETTVPGDDRRVEFKLATGDDSIATVQRMQRNQRTKHKPGTEPNPLIDSLAMRTLSIDGIGDKPKAIRDYFEELEMGNITELVSRFDDQDGGVETSIEVECPSCFRQQVVDLPFDEQFFFPARTRKRAVR